MKIKKVTAPIKAEAEVEVAPEATELLFETDDVAELISEVTGEDVAVEATEDSVEFTVGEDEVYTVEPEGDEEILEACRPKKKRAVKASTNRRVIKRSARTRTRK